MKEVVFHTMDGAIYKSSSRTNTTRTKKRRASLSHDGFGVFDVPFFVSDVPFFLFPTSPSNPTQVQYCSRACSPLCVVCVAQLSAEEHSVAHRRHIRTFPPTTDSISTMYVM